MSEVSVEDILKAVEMLDAHKIPEPHFICTTSGMYRYDGEKWVKDE